MNKVQIIEQLDNGLKVSHKRFLEDEWIKKHATSKKHYIDEQGNVIDKKTFWQYRTAKSWTQDWSLFIQQ